MDLPTILKYGDATLMAALNRVPDSAREAGGVCGVWSVKDIIAHLASYERMLIEVFLSLRGTAETPVLEEMARLGDTFNDAWVEMYRQKSFAEVLTDYREGFAQAMALAHQFAPELLRQPGTLPWYGDEYSVDDFVVYSFYGHKREHSAQLDVYADRLERARDATQPKR
ncbi:MAG: maleylpyruvate isomerase N-terminal domain-containing protein [Anaerolineae bacterium]|nr:maleylpyruvate isomerase N-terminal domain-containing protein [Anaerolineae bacterium]